MSNQPPRIIILTLPALPHGSSHVRMAEALQQAFGQVRSGLQVELVDALSHCTRWFRACYNSYDIPLKYWPALWEYIESRQHSGSSTGPRWLYRWGAQPLFRFIDTVAPDIVIATEVGLGEITALHKRQAQANYSLVGVVAFAFDRPWAQPEFDLFLSSPGEIAAEMRIAGVPSEKICECGMPVLPPFKMPGDWLATRARLGLEYDVPVLLVDFGGSGKRMWQEVVIALWKIQRPLQIVFLSRRSETLYKELLHSTAGMERTRVLPWVDNMYDWMGVADLLVCRAGGCTIAEALNSQLPMLVFGPPPGDERRHCRLIESSWEAGYWAKRPGDLPALLDRLLDHPEEIQRLRANALRQARPQAAYDAAKAILKLRGLDQQ